MDIGELCKNAAKNVTLTTTAIMAIAVPPVLTNTMGYLGARQQYKDTSCAEYHPQREDALSFAAFGIGRKLYIHNKCSRVSEQTTTHNND